MGLEGKVALVTGASGGIGAAVARSLANERVRLGLASRSGADLGLEGAVARACDVREPEAIAAFADEWGFAHGTTRLEEAIDRDDIDAVLIASPSDAHADQAEAALKAGKHVLVEIPVAMSLTDAQRVARLADETGRTLMVAHTQRFLPALMEARRRIATGELTVCHAVCRWFFFRRENVNWAGRRRGYTQTAV